MGLPCAWQPLPGFFPMGRRVPALDSLLLGFALVWGALPLGGRSRLGAASAWSRLSWGPLPPRMLPPVATPVWVCSLRSVRTLPRWAGWVSIVAPPSVPSCIIIIAQDHLAPTWTLSDIFRHGHHVRWAMTIPGATASYFGYGAGRRDGDQGAIAHSDLLHPIPTPPTDRCLALCSLFLRAL